MPTAYVYFFYNHRLLSQIAAPKITLGFLYEGIVDVFAASLLEPIFIHKLNLHTAFIVGMTEEFSKILGVLAITLHRIIHPR
ncbi:MAG: hypothetical protein QHH26_11250 [Armatimonadota bacterium]|nr:hypothetical protein [Armatimonadota bacterium]